MMKTPQCFPFCSQIIHRTQRKKRSNVAAASQLMWTHTLLIRVGRMSVVLTEIVLLCARTLHHFKTPRQPPLKKWLQFISYLLSCHKTSIKNKGKFGYLPRRQKKKRQKKALVSVVNKSQYRDTLSEDTIGNVRDTDYLFFVWSC